MVGLFWMRVGHMGVVFGQELEVVGGNSQLNYLVN